MLVTNLDEENGTIVLENVEKLSTRRFFYRFFDASYMEYV